MRIGLLGPADEGDREALREGIEFLLGDVDAEMVIYLGADAERLTRELEAWATELRGGDGSDEAFLARAAELAPEASADELDALLADDALAGRLARVRKLPASPTRAIELVGDRIVLAVHDKKILVEEDIANAQLIVYGRSRDADLKRFGARYFLTPGPLSGGKVAVVEEEDDSNVSLAIFETSGIPVLRETMSRRSAKVSVVR